MKRPSCCANVHSSCASWATRCSSATAATLPCWPPCWSWPVKRGLTPVSRCRRPKTWTKAGKSARLLKYPQTPNHDPCPGEFDMTQPSAWDQFLYAIYPYICLAVLLLGSLIRYDREPYSWKSDSSEILRAKTLRWGSNLFHYGVLVVVIGHFAGFLLPGWAVHWLISPAQHQLLAMVAGGLAGLIAIIGLTLLIWRRLGDQRIRSNSRKWDITIVLMLWLQLLLGLATLPVSAGHMDGAMFEQLSAYVQSIVYFKGNSAALLEGVPAVYKSHIVLGFTIFLVSPFTRMVHIWSGMASIAYLFRPYQLVRSRKQKEARS